MAQKENYSMDGGEVDNTIRLANAMNTQQKALVGENEKLKSKI